MVSCPVVSGPVVSGPVVSGPVVSGPVTDSECCAMAHYPKYVTFKDRRPKPNRDRV